MTIDTARRMRIGLLVVLIAVGIAMVFTLEMAQGEPDFLAYWSATRLLVTGQNPYDPVSLRALGQETRPDRNPDRGHPFASWNPPWLLIVLSPLGLLPFDLAVRVWMICNIALIGAASVLTWRILPEPLDNRGLLVAMAVSLWSGQSLVTLLTGQTSSLVLVGLVLGAWYLHAGRDTLAGAAFFVATIKPHVTYLVLLLLLLWVVRHRRWQVIWGGIAASLISMAVLSVIFPRWLSAYFTLIRTYRFLFSLYATPTVGSLAHALWGTNLFRFAGILLVPFVFPLLRLVDSRGWLTAMNVALSISVPLAMYGFHSDHVVLLPTMVHIISWLWRGELPIRWARAIGGGLAMLYVMSFRMVIKPGQVFYWFVWTPLALGGLYALAWIQRTRMPGARVDPFVA
jgi:hypothetical protein